ncbi:MAG TPA: choice-of-anchor Q domain-containing protein, partial [Verrucomicrobiae bacterium]|nr:choice-of-anchor Q domain-containing protein [Verrucomicrobiae bacterium]
NIAYDAGGGAYDSTLISCTVTNNLAPFGGGGSFIAPWLASGAFIRNTDFIGNLSQDSGGGAYGGVLTGCSLIGNACVAGSGSPTYGGGACCAVLDRCVLGGNSADYGGGVGDSSGYSVLYNCIVTNNVSTFDGGGLYGGSGSAAYNCAILDNTAGGNGGGAAYYELDNCIIYFNNGAPDGNAGNCSLNFSCTTPSPGGNGNFTNAPAFVDLAAGDLHLQSNSPCINSGSNFYLTNNSESVVIATDFDGNPRVANSLVDVGPFESQLPGSILPYAWLLQYGLPIDGSADYVDSDRDGLNNWQEWIAGTDPTNSASVLAMVSAMPAPDYSSVTVSWQSVSGRSYFLQRSSALSGPPGFTTIQTHIGGQAGTTSYIDYTATGDGPYFYRVGIQQ